MTTAFEELLGGRSARSIHRAGGPDPRTLGRMRRGLPVRSDSVERLAAVLGYPAAVLRTTLEILSARARRVA